MTDRELLEMAAKAAGLPECGWMGPCFTYVKDNTFTEWDPLTSDGDALRLAVKLHMFDGSGLSLFRKLRLQEVRTNAKRSDEEIARRAITRAAAEIGKEMP